MKIIDSHCHLDYDKFENDLDQVINRAKGSGVSKILTICTKKNNLNKNINICEKNDFIFFAYGLHPLNIGKEKIDAKEILRISDHKKMIAIGDTGLDYFYNKENSLLQKNLTSGDQLKKIFFIQFHSYFYWPYYSFFRHIVPFKESSFN